MKYVRVERMGKIRWGVLDGDVVHTLKYPPYLEETEYYDGKKWPLKNCKLLYPCEPSKVVYVDKVYSIHARKAEEGTAGPLDFVVFPPSGLIDPGENFHMSNSVRSMECEFGVALVIKKLAKQVRAAETWSYILGFSCLNRLSPKGVQNNEEAMNDFITVGPIVTDEVDPADLEFIVRLDGEPVMSSHISHLCMTIPQVVETITSCCVLNAGDVVIIGAFEHKETLLPGSSIEFDIKGIGVLQNQILSSTTL